VAIDMKDIKSGFPYFGIEPSVVIRGFSCDSAPATGDKPLIVTNHLAIIFGKDRHHITREVRNKELRVRGETTRLIPRRNKANPQRYYTRVTGVRWLLWSRRSCHRT
jgi:hypothetical protein